MAKKNGTKTTYICSECGAQELRWAGQCPSCKSWNTLEEKTVQAQSDNVNTKISSSSNWTEGALSAGSVLETKTLKNIKANDIDERIQTKIGELDRVLGGGIVQGSVILVTGEPGAGKSTILMQACKSLGHLKEIMYVTGEESINQIKLRANRLGVDGGNIEIIAETKVEDLCTTIATRKPNLVIIDSIQTMCTNDSASSSGSLQQVKASTTAFLSVAKQLNIPFFIVGHVNKDGAVAGPKVLEHIVDTVLFFEGDKFLPFRVLRATKNRFGSTNEVGMFDMTSDGMEEVSNPSAAMLTGRQTDSSGSCIASVMEGSRPILAEIQALTTQSPYGQPRRACSGYDFNRANLLFAVAEKTMNLVLNDRDIYINAVGGLRLYDTSCDLTVIMSLYSSYKNIPVKNDIIAIGEVGLGGEVRSVTNMDQRLTEAMRLGFKRAIISQGSLERLKGKKYNGLELIPITFIKDIKKLF